MGGFSFTEILIVLALVLLLFGPDELPKMAKTLGKGLRELRKAGDDLRSTLESEIVKMEDEPPRREPTIKPPELAPAPPSAHDDPAAARAAARFAAVGLEPPKPPEAPQPAPVVTLAPAEGTVAREAASPPDASQPAAPQPAAAEPAPAPTPSAPAPSAPPAEPK